MREPILNNIDYHIPVMCNEVIKWLITEKQGVYVDCTVGGGGHSRVILDILGRQGVLYGIDKDLDAITVCENKFKDDKRVKLKKGDYGNVDSLLPANVKGKINGIFVDMGISSHQIDIPSRGFSYLSESELDMRMDRAQDLDACQILNTYSEKKIQTLLFEYGDVHKSRILAKNIIKNRPINSTKHLCDIVRSVFRQQYSNKILSKVFQAIRIEVNQELYMLVKLCRQIYKLLCPQGRMVCLSYHSLEDKIVKNTIKTGNPEGVIMRDVYGNRSQYFDPLFNGVIRPSTEEVIQNPRSRSAKLRAAKKMVKNYFYRPKHKIHLQYI